MGPLNTDTTTGLRDYYVKFTALVTGDNAPPVTKATVYTGYQTVITITYPPGP